MIENIDYRFLKPEKSKKVFVFFHGLYSDVNSSKATQIENYAKKTGDGSYIFSFRGNGKSISEDFGFQDMDLETMAQDCKNIFDYLIENGYSNLVPVCSSLGASSFLYFLKNNPEYKKFISKIVLAAPSLEFAENRKRLWKQKGDETSEKKWKQQGFLIEENFGDKKLSYKLFDQSEKTDLINFLENLELPIILVAGRQDDIIDFDKLNSIGSKNKNITFVGVHDTHRLNTFDKILPLIFS